ncbi:DNA-directed RNA polymerase III subunit RPC5 [Auxenochlorella protothecoides]|uniref:DNA-directed RNA polymerase III subunit RPC5 n=1 Tax=Auxenochlorella protothecoides TaxID=3075 RepID=A0A087SU00_AUXPR|nr:DNA-directed RNA polymerase III subunit RPC5 [Auxenochlorella protothecoides]KFM29204.1 DNA-directed RNA polymerase III subunit RPC5 [Auxenochlorella protothecoides]
MEEDYIVRELDVVVCSGSLGTGSQTVLLQYPLRGASRPYQSSGVEAVQYKPKNKRLQVVKGRHHVHFDALLAANLMDVRLDTTIPEYNDNVEPTRLLKKLTLQSSSVECGTSLAAAFVEGDRLILLPIDEAMQLRPSMAHLDAEREGGKKAAPKEEEGPDAGVLMPVMVQVKKRETEAQLEARLRSFAHITAQEAAEEWVGLQYHDDMSETSQGIAQKLAAADAQPALHPMRAGDYLAALVPDPDRDGAGVAGMGRALGPLFHHSPVCNLGAIRGYLQRSTAEPGLAAAVAAASDAALHMGVLATGLVLEIRRAYVLRSLGSPALDPLRDLLLGLLAGREALKRGDIMEAARAAGIPVTDGLYSKVVRDICVSRGSTWSLKVT